MHKICFEHLNTGLLLFVIRTDEFTKVCKAVKDLKSDISIVPSTFKKIFYDYKLIEL